ncbi:MAG: GIY-YIG nuclease family protein, partial [Patescibacteria group bacterium]|nr:GIY-YIG nuclease family protein [Patescibacteria group bacterium]
MKFYYVYILLSLKDKRFYKGFTTDLKDRLEHHNKGLNESTKNRRPLKLIYYESYLNEQDARQREKFLKSGRGREIINKQLEKTLKNIK